MKRFFDIIFSAGALLLLAPLVLILCLLIRLKLGSPIFFRQARPGLAAKTFRMTKFRTMTDALDENGELQSDELRLTAFGKWLRSTSLDELPELWNVLKGEMSLVGPRPLLVSYLERYSPEQARRHEVRPGLTGWAQINGRNATSWDERFALDIWYVDHRSFFLDLKIILLTAKTVLRKDGISHNEHATMPEFGIDENRDSH